MVASVSIMAQKVQTVDTDGNPVSYASISNADNGNIIGTTDLQGVLPDVGGVRSIAITHVAFKPQVVKVSELPADGRVTLTESDFDLPEITVEPKEYIYVQTYYRMFFMEDDTLFYYRAGLTDNEYNIQKKKLSASTRNFSRSGMGGFVRWVLDAIIGSKADQHSELSIENIAFNTSKSGLSLRPETDSRQAVLYGDSLVGFMVDDVQDHQRRISIDDRIFVRLYWNDRQSEKKQKKRAEREAKRKNVVSTRYLVYAMDDDHQCGISDFISSQIHDDYDQFSERHQKDVHNRLWIEVFTTDRAYCTRDELKARKRENKLKLNFESILEFERQHQIPPAPANTIEALRKIVED